MNWAFSVSFSRETDHTVEKGPVTDQLACWCCHEARLKTVVIYGDWRDAQSGRWVNVHLGLRATGGVWLYSDGAWCGWPQAKPRALCRVTVSFKASPYPNSYVMYPIQTSEWGVKGMKYQSCLFSLFFLALWRFSQTNLYVTFNRVHVISSSGLGS